MELEFRARNYADEHQSQALPRSRAHTHPLSPLSSSSPSRQQQAATGEGRDSDFLDPLRGLDVYAATAKDVQDSSTSSETAIQDPSKEWASFKKILMQRFPVLKVVSSSPMSNIIMKSAKEVEKPSVDIDGQQNFPEEAAKMITRQEYLAQANELRDGITRAWHAEDRVTSLKLSIKVAKLLMDTTVLQFYPTVFVIATDVLDTLGNMVWERIKQKAELAEDGTILGSLPKKAFERPMWVFMITIRTHKFEGRYLDFRWQLISFLLSVLKTDSFRASNICLDAKETCYNWFCKVGSIRELLPRIYLELAILPCWRFLHDQPIEVLERLVMMVRGVADPLASTYCRLYMVHCMQKLVSSNAGYVIKCIKDTEDVLMPILSDKETVSWQITDDKRLLFSLMEPAVEYIMKCALMIGRQKTYVSNTLEELGFGRHQVELSYNFPRVSILLHYLLKELPLEVVSSQVMEILHSIKGSKDCSLNQSLNYRLLGIRLSEDRSQVGSFSAVISEVIQAVSQYDSLDDYLKIVEAYVDIILQNKMYNHLHTVLEGIINLARNKDVSEDEQASLQSIFVKLLYHLRDLQEVFALKHFIEILDLMYGNSRSVVNMHLLNMGSRNGRICDPTTVQLLFEVSQALHDATDFANMKDDGNQEQARLISRFVEMVDHGAEMERHLTFLAECRGAFSGINELKEKLVHSSNILAVKAMKDGRKHVNFVKSCIAFSEVTIPSVSAPINQLNLYLETAEVALLGGFVSHLDGLVESAVEYLENAVLTDGSRSIDMDGIASVVRKLCSLLVMVPGNPEKGVTEIPKSIFSVVCSSSWATPRLRVRILCAIISLSATLCQDKLPYHACNPEIIGNDLLFFGDSSFKRELLASTELVLHKLVDVIEQEPSQIVRGNMALEACNCIASSLAMNKRVSKLCSRLLETAKVCLSANDRYVQSTKNFLETRLPTSTAAAAFATV